MDELNVAPQLAGVERKTATSELAEEINSLTELLSEAVDPLMRQFKGSYPTFFGEYQNARRIGGRGTRDEKDEPVPESSRSESSSPSQEDAEADVAAVTAEADLIRRETGAGAAQAGNGAVPAPVLAS